MFCKTFNTKLNLVEPKKLFELNENIVKILMGWGVAGLGLRHLHFYYLLYFFPYSMYAYTYAQI